MTWADLVARYNRIAVVGGPRTGKTTLVMTTVEVDDRPVFHTDDLIGLVEWADQPAVIIERCAPLDRYVVEGIQVARALRKGLEPDVVVVTTWPMVERTSGQKRLARAVDTWFHDWLAQRPDHGRALVWWLQDNGSMSTCAGLTPPDLG